MSRQRGLRALVLLACLLLVTPAAGQVRPQKLFLPLLRRLAPARSLVIASGRDSLVELYVMSSNGTMLRRLTNSPEQEFNPTWSPDGELIAYVQTSIRIFPTRSSLHIVRADGTADRVVAPDLPAAYHPVWSPDGSRLAFEGIPTTDVFGDLTTPDIYVVNRDGSDLRRLTNTPQPEEQISWAPDGKRLAFVSWRQAATMVVEEIGIDVRGRRALSPFLGIEPAWSPDGTRVAFTGKEDSNPEGYFAIYAQPTAGGPMQRLAVCERGCSQPAWSPDGSRLAFLERLAVPGTDYARIAIAVVGADGQGRTRILDDVLVEDGPKWAPDGLRIAVAMLREIQQHEVLVMNSDGSDLRSLGEGTELSWGP